MDGECVEQERRSQTPSSWSKLNPAGEWKDRDSLRKRRVPQSRRFLRWYHRPDVSEEGISPRKNEITESRAALASQELQGFRTRDDKPSEVGTNFVRHMLPETPAH